MSETKTDNGIRPTKKQKELLSYIEQFIGQHGYSPSYREIMNGLQYTSVATVALHVGNLIKRGHLRKRDHSARSLEVVRSSLALTEAEPVTAAQEKWLVNKIEDRLIAFQNGQAERADLDTLIAALRILGLDAAARSLSAQLAANGPQKIEID